MDLVKTILRLDLAEPLSPWLELRALFRMAGEDASAELQGQPVIVARQQKRQRVIIQVRSVSLEDEGARNIDEALTRTAEFTRDVNSASELPELRSFRFDAMFIEPFSLPFHELVARMKLQFFRAQELVDSATDIEMSLDFREDTYSKHLQLGPMMPGQLQETYLAFPRERLPAQFLFVSLARSRTAPLTFDQVEMEEFLNQTAPWQVQTARTIADGVLERTVG
jgi:hypothetical protein